MCTLFLEVPTNLHVLTLSHRLNFHKIPLGPAEKAADGGVKRPGFQIQPCH